MGRIPQKQFYSAKATVINIARAKRQDNRTLPEGIGKRATRTAYADFILLTRTKRSVCSGTVTDGNGTT